MANFQVTLQQINQMFTAKSTGNVFKVPGGNVYRIFPV